MLGSIQHASQDAADAADAAHEQAGKAANDSSHTTEAALRKAADVAGVASDRVNSGFSTDETVYTSETRRATAGQVADYAAK